MKTFSFAAAAKGFIAWCNDVELAQREMLNVLCEKLKEWAVEEHAWKPDRPHTEGTIDAFVVEVTSERMVVRLQADMDAGLWLELARGGKWAWLWPVIVNHEAEIQAIIRDMGAMPEGAMVSDDLEAQYDEAAEEMYGLRVGREHRRSVR